MDPEANLNRQREIVREVFGEGSSVTRENALDLLVELAELVDSLDLWRRKGGFDPYAKAA